MKKQIFFRILFLAIASADVVTSAVGHVEMHIFLKPLIMLSLIVYYFTSSKSLQAFFVLTMLLSLAGDVFLLYEEVNSIFFLLGLGTFLIVHLFLIVTYRRNQLNASTDPLIGVRRLRMAFPLLLTIAGFTVFILPKLGDFRIPVLVYTGVLTAMVLVALFRYGRVDEKSFWLVFTGAILFLISDSLLGLDKFAVRVPHATTWVMLTYCSAQYLIAEGILVHERREQLVVNS